MPASSGDPISAAVTHSLAASSKFSSDVESLDSKLIGSAKRVLITEIKYEQTSSYSHNVSELKSKYIVLKPSAHSDGSEIKLKNGLSKVKDTSNDSKICEPPSPNCSKVCSNTKPMSPGIGGMKSDAVLPSPKKVLFPPDKIQLGWQSKTVPIGSGMVNLGNTCYLNSTLQALFHVPSFVNWLLNDKAHKDKCETMNGLTHTECLICAMLRTLKNSMENSASTNNPIRPHLIYNKLKLICKRLMHGHQEDAHEFLRYLIESMDRSYLRIMQANNLDSYSKETTPLSQIFGGYLRTEVRCLECRHISLTFQHFQDLLLDIRQSSTLDEALEAYFSRERLGEGEEAYKCDKCHRRVAATKQFAVEKPPNVLCIQLKRFGILGGKNSKHIQIQQNLDLTRFWVHCNMQPGCRFNYRLVSLVSHIGPSSNCGHYTAIGLTSSGQFYLFDDSMVRPVSSQSVSGNNTYIIMYELCSTNPSFSGSPTKTFMGNCTVTKPSQSTSSTSSVNGTSKSLSPPVVNGNHSPQQTTPIKTMLNSPNNTASTKNGEKSQESSHKAVPTQNGVNGKETHRKSMVNGHGSADSASDESRRLTNGSSNHNYISNGKNWDGNRNTDTVQFLRKNSHHGYGSNVTTWNGNRSQVDREVDNDRLHQRKRSYDQMYDEDYDQGKIKKTKPNHHYQKNDDRQMNGRRNYFQEHQNHKNHWHDKNHFYRTYSNNNHFRSYQNNRNPNYHWRR